MALSALYYRKFAAMLRGELTLAQAKSNDTARNAAVLQVRNVVLSSADLFKQDNANFDRERFYEASGVNLLNPDTLRFNAAA